MFTYRENKRKFSLPKEISNAEHEYMYMVYKKRQPLKKLIMYPIQNSNEFEKTTQLIS